MGTSTSSGSPARWRFLTNHGNVLLCIARDPEARVRDIAERIEITERSAQRIVSDLIAEGYLERTKVGRRNRYKVNGHAHLRHPYFAGVEVNLLLALLQSRDGAKPNPSTKA